MTINNTMAGDELRALRQAIGLSQSEMAELLRAALGISAGPKRISDWENHTEGRRVPRHVAHYLNANRDRLLASRDQKGRL